MAVCAKDGCPVQVARGYCDDHRPPTRRSASSTVTGTYRWRNLKRRVLYRDGYVCQLGLPGCARRATVVDHLEPVSLRPDLAFSEANLVAACNACNARKGGRPLSP